MNEEQAFEEEAQPKASTQQPAAVGVNQRDWGKLRDVHFRLTVEVGRTRLRVRDILDIREGSLIATTKLSGEPMDISLNSDIFARSEIIIIKDKLWARLTKIVGGEQ
jgi:flagellar motor switch protein FliN/FliY